MSNIRMLIDRQPMKNVILKKGNLYEVIDIVQDCYKVVVPMKRTGKYWHVLVNEGEGELVD